jgi:hypothetical protein
MNERELLDHFLITFRPLDEMMQRCVNRVGGSDIRRYQVRV